MNYINFSILTILISISTHTAKAYKIRTLLSDDKNVTKRESDFFPDWVPFRNKQGDELGEFVAVKKTKPKKRLAPPINFQLKAVAEGDDYYDKDQGGGDSDDYFEKKDWSDLNRVSEAPVEKKETNHTELVDIDGIKTIVPHKHASKHNREQKMNKLKKINNLKAPKPTTQSSKHKRDEYDSDYDDSSGSSSEIDKTKTEQLPDEKRKEIEESKKKEIEEEKRRETEEEKRENEEKRAKILESVDKLKELHAAEQNVLIEKAKEEEMFREDQQRFFTSDPGDKYAPQSESRLSTQMQTFVDDYEDRGDPEKYVSDKYSEVHETPPGTTSSTEIYKTTTTKRTTTAPRTRVTVDTGKLSIFRNPQAYMVYDYPDSSEEALSTSSKRPKTISYETTKRTSKTTNRPIEVSRTNSSHEDLSLVPTGPHTNPDEPALFFPKPRKNKKTRGPKTSTVKYTTFMPIFDTLRTSSEMIDATRTSVTDSVPSAADTAPSAVDSTTTKSVLVDPDADSTSHHNRKAEKLKEEKKHEHGEYEKGHGHKYNAEHNEERGESGKKAYEGFHKDQKTAKGHHDKEDHLGKYDDRGGFDKKHHDESGHYGEHEHAEQGKKHAQYEESGKHSKGHSTKGSHDIHKKEEYEKNVVFFEEEGDSAEVEKHGGFKENKKHARGGGFGRGKANSGHEAHSRGETGKFQKGSHSEQIKDVKSSAGHDRFGRQHALKSNAGNAAGGKHWIYHHGQPARSASLTVIDRRKDTKHPLHILVG